MGAVSGRRGRRPKAIFGESYWTENMAKLHFWCNSYSAVKLSKVINKLLLSS